MQTTGRTDLPLARAPQSRCAAQRTCERHNVALTQQPLPIYDARLTVRCPSSSDISRAAVEGVASLPCVRDFLCRDRCLCGDRPLKSHSCYVFQNTGSTSRNARNDCAELAIPPADVCEQRSQPLRDRDLALPVGVLAGDDCLVGAAWLRDCLRSKENASKRARRRLRSRPPEACDHEGHADPFQSSRRRSRRSPGFYAGEWRAPSSAQSRSWQSRGLDTQPGWANRT